MSSSAAGVRAASGEDAYYQGDREDLRALLPATARRVLDVGCGRGGFGAALKAERGCEVVGLEGVPEVAATAAARLDGVLCVDLDALESLPHPPGHFDAMVFGDVLEHLRDPVRLVRALLPHLHDDGVVLWSVPNVKHWSVVLPLLLQDRWPYADSGLLDRTHVHLFTLEEISLALDELGLAVEHLGATSVGALPAETEHVLEAVHRMGGDRAETAARMLAYQYLVVARRAG